METFKTKTNFSATEAAKYLGISYWLIIKLVREKKIPHCRLGSRIIFRKETLEKFIIEQEIESIAK